MVISIYIECYTTGMISTIIFDLYGVLREDPYLAWLKNHNLAKDGAYKVLADEADLGNISREEFYQQLSQISDVAREDIENAFSSKKSIDPQIITILTSLRPEYKLGLITNGSRHTRDFLEESGLAPLFNDIIVSSEVGLIKPDVQIFKLALERLDSTPEETLFIDDTKQNVLAAEALGIKAVQYESLDQFQALLNK